jgi:hypothetical protein
MKNQDEIFKILKKAHKKPEILQRELAENK